jgi:site-specific DNA recombinase
MNHEYHTMQNQPSDYTALIYCRVSDRKQLKGSGLDSQEHRCRQHAAMHHYPVEKTFLENSSGGLELAERRALQELLRYLEQQKKSGKRYVVIFDDHKRFARQTQVHLQLKYQLASLGAKIEYLNFTIEDSPEGTFFETMLAAQAQLEREQNRRQTRQKTIARLEKGFWTFRAPVGYKYISAKTGGKELIRDEPLATVVQEALEGFACGRFSCQAEVKRFLENDPHFPKDLPNGEIRQQTVIRVMEQILYAGYIESKSHGVSLRKGQHPALISLETFEKVQKRRQDNGYLPARKDIHKDFVLRGAVHCASCTKPLRSSWTKAKYDRYAYYLCQNKACEVYGKSIPRDRIEGEFEAVIKTIQPPRPIFDLVKAMFKDAWEAQAANAVSATQTFALEAEKVEKEIADLISRVMQASSARVITAYETRIEELEKTKALLQEKALKTHAPKHSFDKMLELSMLFLASPYKLWSLGSFEVRRIVLKLAFSGPITYDQKTGARTPLKAAVHKAFMPLLPAALQNGAPDRTRTCNLQIRSLTSSSFPHFS